MSNRDVVLEANDFRGGLYLTRGTTDADLRTSTVLYDVLINGDGSLRPRPNLLMMQHLAAYTSDDIVYDPLYFHHLIAPTPPNRQQGNFVNDRSILLYTERRDTRTAQVVHDWDMFTASNWRNRSVVSASSSIDITWNNVAATKPYPVSFASVGGTLYVCLPGKPVLKVLFGVRPDDHARAGEAYVSGTTQLPYPFAGRTYNRSTLHLNETPDPHEWERTSVTTISSWSEDFDNPFADIRTINDRGRFPPSDFIYAVNSGGSEYMFSACDSCVRWSHPLTWKDSAYYGASWSASGDKGPDWPTSMTDESGNVYPTAEFPLDRHTSDEDAELRLFGPEDWSLYNYVDVAPDDGDTISAMLHHFDTMLVFKHRSMYGLVGQLPDQLSLVSIARGVGCVGQRACVSTPYGVFFFSYPEGLMRWRPDGSLVNVSQQLGDFAEIITNNPVRLSQIVVGFHEGRIFLSLPERFNYGVQPSHSYWRGGVLSDQRTMYVYNILHDAWVEWSLPAISMLPLAVPDAGDDLLFDIVPVGSAGNQQSRFMARLDWTRLPAETKDQIRDNDARTGFVGERPWSAHALIGAATDPELPDVELRFRRSDIVFGSVDGETAEAECRHKWYCDGSNEVTAGRGTTDYTLPYSRLEIRPVCHARNLSALISWNTPKAVLKAVTFTWWRGRRFIRGRRMGAG